MIIITYSSAALYYTNTLIPPCVIKTLSWIHEGIHICEKYGIRIRNVLKREHETPKIGGAKIHRYTMFVQRTQAKHQAIAAYGCVRAYVLHLTFSFNQSNICVCS